MRVTLAASVLILALAAPAAGLNKEEWIFIESRGARLIYGVPESDVVSIVFACDPKKKSIEIVTTLLPLKPKKGQSLKTTLSNGAVTASYDGKTGHHSEHGFHFEAQTPAEPKLVEVLKSGTTLTIGIPGRQLRVPLKGVAKPLAQFETACFGKR